MVVKVDGGSGNVTIGQSVGGCLCLRHSSFKPGMRWANHGKNINLKHKSKYFILLSVSDTLPLTDRIKLISIAFYFHSMENASEIPVKFHYHALSLRSLSGIIRIVNDNQSITLMKWESMHQILACQWIVVVTKYSSNKLTQIADYFFPNDGVSFKGPLLRYGPFFEK